MDGSPQKSGCRPSPTQLMPALSRRRKWSWRNAMSRHVIGIDLGTTNCALSWRDLNEGAGEVLPIPQLTAPGTIEERSLLPSFVYVAKQGEFPSGAFAVPWDKKAAYAAGEFARAHGAKVPTRL